MRRLVALLLALAACKETNPVRAPPVDRFLSPTGLAVIDRAGGGKALLVVSSNFNLEFDGATGGTVLSVNPDLAADGGSAGAANKDLVKLPADGGARIASFAGQIAVADATTCPGYDGPSMALVPSRYDDGFNVLPLGTGSALGSLKPSTSDPCADPLLPCTLPASELAFRPELRDPWSTTLACRAPAPLAVPPFPGRRSVFVGFQTPSILNGFPSGIGWLEEYDVDELGALAAGQPVQPTGRALEVGATPISDAVYDAETDRIIAVGRPFLLTAPIIVIELPPCRIDGSPVAGQTATGPCAQPVIRSTDLNAQLPGTDPQGVALSNPGSGSRRAYVSARIYDATIASIIGGRPLTDIASALLVVDLEDNRLGAPAMIILRVVPLGMGASQVRVLPPRPPRADGTPRRDLVVASGSTEGVVTIYDDDEELVARAIGLDPTTGGAQAGRLPFALAVEPTTRGTAAAPVARVYVAGFDQSVVSILDVPLLAPGQSHLLHDGADGTTGTLLRIGGKL